MDYKNKKSLLIASYSCCSIRISIYMIIKIDLGAVGEGPFHCTLVEGDRVIGAMDTLGSRGQRPVHILESYLVPAFYSLVRFFYKPYFLASE
jgi:hypothetical protein